MSQLLYLGFFRQHYIDERREMGKNVVTALLYGGTEEGDVQCSEIVALRLNPATMRKAMVRPAMVRLAKVKPEMVKLKMVKPAMVKRGNVINGPR